MRLIDADALKDNCFIYDCDLISREDAIDVVMKHKMPFTIQQEVARKICALPSADRPTENFCRDCPIYSADRPTGEWIDREDSTDLFFLYKYECSVCGGKNVLNSSYCPNCGAHMR